MIPTPIYVYAPSKRWFESGKGKVHMTHGENIKVALCGLRVPVTWPSILIAEVVEMDIKDLPDYHCQRCIDRMRRENP